MFDYRGKIIVVTGAAQGIGKAVSVRFAEAGAIVVLTDIQLAPLKKTVTELQRRGFTAYAFQCDVTCSESVAALASSVLQCTGIPDIVYNNAVVVRTGGMLNAGPDNIPQEFDVNVLGYLRVAQVFLPHMVTQGTGRIVNTISPNAFIPPPMVTDNLLGYCTTKGAGVSMSYCMAISLRPKGIGASVIFPDVTYPDSVNELQGNASTDFHQGLASFTTPHSRPADLVAGIIVDRL